MIKGDKPSGYGVTTVNGKQVITEFRQCSHCQAMWPFVKGANAFGRTVGLCDYCMGLLCANCVKIRWEMRGGKCVPYSEGMQDEKNYSYHNVLGIFLRKK